MHVRPLIGFQTSAAAALRRDAVVRAARLGRRQGPAVHLDVEHPAIARLRGQLDLGLAAQLDSAARGGAAGTGPRQIAVAVEVERTGRARGLATIGLERNIHAMILELARDAVLAACLSGLILKLAGNAICANHSGRLILELAGDAVLARHSSRLRQHKELTRDTRPPLAVHLSRLI